MKRDGRYVCVSKMIVTAVLLCLAAALLPLSVSAASDLPGTDESETMPEGWGEWLDGIPEDVRDVLPEGVFSDGRKDVLAGVEEAADPGYLLRLCGGTLLRGLGDGARLLATLSGMILLTAVLGALGRVAGAGRTAPALRLISRLSVLSAILTLGYRTVGTAETYFSRLGVCMSALTPLMATLWALGGDVGSAAAGSRMLLLFIGLCEWLCEKTVLPMLAVSLLSTVAGTFGPGLDLHGCTAFVRRFCGTLTGFITMLFSTVMGLQTTVASRADSIAMKSARFAVSSFVPVTGSTLSGLLSTLGGSVSLLRGTVGTLGVVVVLLLLFPPVVSLLLTRLCFMAAGSLAELLGCEGEAGLCREMTGLYGYLAGMAALCAGMFLLALAVFIRSVPACGL